MARHKDVTACTARENAPVRYAPHQKQQSEQSKKPQKLDGSKIHQTLLLASYMACVVLIVTGCYKACIEDRAKLNSIMKLCSINFSELHIAM